VISRRWNTVMYRGSCYATAAVIAVATAATATAVATAAAASREAVPSQVSCVRAIFAFLSKTNLLQSGCFNFPFQQSLKMEFKPLGFHQVGALSELVLRDRGPSRPICIKKNFPPTINVYTMSFVYLQLDQNLRRSTKF